MKRFWPRRGARPRASTRSADGSNGTATHRHPDEAIHINLRAGRAPGHAQATVLRASVLARLLGIRLLRLDADIAIVPAEYGPGTIVEPPRQAIEARALADGTGDLREAQKLLAHASRTLNETTRVSRSPSTDA